MHYQLGNADPRVPRIRLIMPDNRFEWRDTYASYPEDSRIFSQPISHEKTLLPRNRNGTTLEWGK